jgi:putative DNA primase/helicase
MIPLDLRAIARALGGEVAGQVILAPGPGHSAKDRSLSFRLSANAPDGFQVYSFAADNWRVCRDYVRNRLSLRREKAPWSPSGARRPGPKTQSENRTVEKKIADALTLWSASGPPRGTLVERYLNSRGLILSDDLAGDVLRWHPGIAAMIALFRNIQTNKPQAVSRTFLDRDGGKIKRMFKGPVGGAAVKLDADENVLNGLHVGEGVETCVAARQLGLRPVWALGSKHAIGNFAVLSGVEALTILVEPDAAAEVEACANRWHAAGREVSINRAVGGKDLNDAVRRAS